MPTGIPNKKKDMLKEIDKEAGVGTIEIQAEAPVKVEGSNEFGNEYTMEVLMDNEEGSDIFRIPNKDPKFAYRFLSDRKENISVKTSNLLLNKGGWQICPMKHLERIGIKKEVLHPDGSYRVGELILAFMPKELFDKKVAEDRRKSSSAEAGVQRLVDGDSRINMPGVKGISKGTKKTGPLHYGTHNAIDD